MDRSNIKKYIEENYVRDLNENPLELFPTKDNSNSKDKYLLDLAKEKSKSVVNLILTRAGTGFIIAETEENLYLVTNFHLLERNIGTKEKPNFEFHKFISNIIFQDCDVKFDINALAKYFERGEKNIFYAIQNIDIAIVRIPKCTLIYPENHQFAIMSFDFAEFVTEENKASNLPKNLLTMIIGNMLNLDNDCTLSFGNNMDLECSITPNNSSLGYQRSLIAEQIVYEGNSGSPIMNIKGNAIGICANKSDKIFDKNNNVLVQKDLCGFLPSSIILFVIVHLQTKGLLKEDIKLKFNDSKEWNDFIERCWMSKNDPFSVHILRNYDKERYSKYWKDYCDEMDEISDLMMSMRNHKAEKCDVSKQQKNNDEEGNIEIYAKQLVDDVIQKSMLAIQNSEPIQNTNEIVK